MGRPLIAWTICSAREAGLDRIIVSTDSDEIASVALEYGAEVPFKRPASLAEDDTGTLPVILHALGECPAETVVLLQPTSPLRTASHIRDALALHHRSQRPIVSICPAKPWLFDLDQENRMNAVLPITHQRQAANLFAPNGAIYIASAGHLMDGRTFWEGAVGFKMPFEDSIDIDDPIDLVIAEALFHGRNTELTESQAAAIAFT